MQLEVSPDGGTTWLFMWAESGNKVQTGEDKTFVLDIAGDLLMRINVFAGTDVSVSCVLL